MLHAIRTGATHLGLYALVGLFLVATGCSDSSSGGGGSSSTTPQSVRDRLARGDIASVRDQKLAVKEQVIQLLADEDANIRVAAATVIGQWKADGASAVPALLAAMKYDVGRPEITYAIQDIGTAAVPYVVNGVTSPDATVRKYATKILASVGWGKEAAGAVDGLIEMLQSGDTDDKTNAVLALASIGSAAEPAIPAIREVEASSTGTLKKHATGAIKRIEDAKKPGMYSESR